MAIARLKMKDVCNLYNVIEIFCRKKITKIERGGAFGLFKLQITLAQLCKNTSTLLCKHPNTSITRGRWGVGHNSFVFWLEPHRKQQIFGWCKIREVNLLMLS